MIAKRGSRWIREALTQIIITLLYSNKIRQLSIQSRTPRKFVCQESEVIYFRLQRIMTLFQWMYSQILFITILE